MDPIICDEDLLSGIELLPMTEPNTPSNALKEISVKNQIDSVSGTPVKSTSSRIQTPIKSSNHSGKLLMSEEADEVISSNHYQTPVKSSPSNPVPSFSDKALEVQKALQSSLTMSLRKEAELKTKWQASPGEVFVNKNRVRSSLELKQPLSPATTVHYSVPTKLDFLTLPPSDIESSPQKKAEKPHKLAEPVLTNKSSGPNVCLSNQFPSEISPIKSHASEKDESALMELSHDGKGFGEDVNTKKLLDYIQKLEKGSVSDVTLAERMNQLSFMLKNSSMNSGTKSDTEEPPEMTLNDKKEKSKEAEGKDLQHQQFITKLKASNNVEKSKPEPYPKLGGSKSAIAKKSEPPSHVSANPAKRTKTKSNSAVSQASTQRSVHFAQANKLQRKKSDMRNGQKSKSGSVVVGSDLSSVKPQKLKSSVEVPQRIERSPSKPVKEMNAIRNHLQNMLSLPKVESTSLDLPSCTELHVGAHDSKDEETFRSTDTATLLSVQPSELMTTSPSKRNSLELTESLTSELFAILKSNNKQSNSARSSIDSSIAAENGVLRETLEKETYRRKHCEKQIQKLQKRVLEIQQELAVAHSTDRKKDMMIEQLDKTLAKVVGGWKTHEANLVKTVEELTSGKEKNREEIVHLKEMVVNLENELAKALEELVEEKERILRLEQNEKAIQHSYQARAEEISHVIDQKNAHAQKLQKKLDDLKGEKSSLQKNVDQLTLDLKDQEKMFREKESQWEEAVNDIEKRQKDLLEKEKEMTRQERGRCSTIQSSLSSTEQEVSRLQALLESQRGEVESMHTQMAIAEAKHQADLQKLEAEQKILAERQVMEKLARVHEESQANETRIREGHKKQMLEIISSHKRELESQCRRYEDELQKRDESMRRTIAEHELAMSEKLKCKSEDMRTQMLSKMQNLLQTHYNETLQIVGNTTGVTPQRAPITSRNESFHVTPQRAPISNESFHSTTDPTVSFRKSVVTSQEVASLSTSSGYKANNEGSVAKPIPTFPSAYHHNPTFSLATSLPPPHVSSFQPLSAPPTSTFQSSVPLLAPRAKNPTTESTSINSLNGDADEAITNLSLMSSIGYCPVTSSAPKEANRNGLYDATTKAHDVYANDPLKAAEERHNIDTFPVASSADESTASGYEHLRQVQLQHYVQMLLQRSPGDPVDSSSAEPDPVQKSDANKEENKENAGIKMAFPMTSYPQGGAPNQLQFANQAKTIVSSSDDRQQYGMTTMFVPTEANANRSLAVDKRKLGVAVELKKGKQNVRFAQGSLKDENQRTGTSRDDASLPAHFLNPAQMGEITQILDLYSATDTPSGETRLAAEQLLRYLRDNNTSTTAVSNVALVSFSPAFEYLSNFQGSIHPSITSSPVKKTKQVSKSLDAHVATMGGKSRVKVGLSPGKQNPVWR